MKNSYLFILFALLSAGLCLPLTAQVTIGGDKAPESFSALELISNQTAGMRLPQMTTIQRNTMTSGFGTLAATEAKGLTIYNTDLECMEYWDGVKWISGGKVAVDDCADACDCDGDGLPDCACFAASPPANCETDDSDPCSNPVSGLSATASSASVIVGTTVTITVTAGTGVINNLSVDGGTTRISGNTITVRPVSIGANTYTVTVNNCPTQIVEVSVNATTCTPIAEIEITGCSNYMFTYQLLTLTASKTTAGSPPSYYQWYINGNPMEGATNDTYVIDGSKILTAHDGRSNYTANLQITCEMGNACGIQTSNAYPLLVVQAQMGMNSLIYIRFDGIITHPISHANMGAEYETDPCALWGDLYQWGRTTDGHEKRNSPAYPTNNSSAENGMVSGAASFDTYGQIASTHAAYGKFIKTLENQSPYDWRIPQKDSIWIYYIGGASFTQPSDPCPKGMRVMSAWNSIFKSKSDTVGGASGEATSNSWRWAKYGYIINEALFLPAAGYRSRTDGQLYAVGTEGYYWHSYPGDGNIGTRHIYFNTTHVKPYESAYRANGYSVRCSY